MPLEMISEFKARLANAGRYGDERYASFLLASDPLAGKLTPGLRREITGGALRCGTETAGRLRERFGAALPREIALRSGLRIEEGSLSQPRLVLSSYDSRAAVITLNSSLIEQIDRFLSVENLLPAGAGSAEIAVAHELFHHAESADPAIFTRTYRITLWGIGPLCYRSAVPMASEIAAGACARALCRLSFHPLLLEPILLRTRSTAEAEDWFDRFDRAENLPATD